MAEDLLLRERRALSDATCRRRKTFAAAGQDDGKVSSSLARSSAIIIEPLQRLERHAVFVIRAIKRDDGDAPFAFEKDIFHTRSNSK